MRSLVSTRCIAIAFHWPSFFLAMAAALALTSPAAAHEAVYTAPLLGSSEVPPNASPGTGSVRVTIDFDLVGMRLEVNFSSLGGNVTAAHIHCCIPPGTNIGVATMLPTFTGFPLGVTSGFCDQTFDMSLASSYNPAFITNNGGTVGSAFNALVAGLTAGNAYLNIHTTTFPGGEIRGLLAVLPTLQSAASRKVHGAQGTFDLPLAATPLDPTTETRQSSTATIVMTFDAAIISASAAVTEGTAVAGAPTFSGNDVIVGLTGVMDQQYVTISLTNVASAVNTGGTGSIRLGFLVGDVNQNRVVTVGDLGLVNAQLAQPVTAANYLKDVNATGTLTVGDKGITNANLTKALPAP